RRGERGLLRAVRIARIHLQELVRNAADEQEEDLRRGARTCREVTELVGRIRRELGREERIRAGRVLLAGVRRAPAEVLAAPVRDLRLGEAAYVARDRKLRVDAEALLHVDEADV